VPFPTLDRTCPNCGLVFTEAPGVLDNTDQPVNTGLLGVCPRCALNVPGQPDEPDVT
jgi:hypothetical protein